MKPEFEQIIAKPQNSYEVKEIIRESRPLLSQAWHYHPELEICFTRLSNGKRFVGNNISNYVDGDLVMIGSNVPHGFTTPTRCEQVVIQMQHDFLGKEFLEKPEIRDISKLFERSKLGLSFHGATKKKAIKKINKILKKDKGQKLIAFLDLLQTLADDKEAQEICDQEYALDLDIGQLNRIKLVYSYIIKNYQKEIHIHEVAQLINLTESAFYKFIKRHTKKTLTQIINEFRINHATKLLSTSNQTISAICYESGFNNLSYFNRKFKDIMGTTPQDYRTKYDG